MSYRVIDILNNNTILLVGENVDSQKDCIHLDQNLRIEVCFSL